MKISTMYTKSWAHAHKKRGMFSAQKDVWKDAVAADVLASVAVAPVRKIQDVLF